MVPKAFPPYRDEEDLIDTSAPAQNSSGSSTITPEHHASESEVYEDNTKTTSGSRFHDTVVPIWLQDSSTYSKRIGLLCNSARHGIADCLKRIGEWSKGPDPVQTQHIKPFFASVQELPIRLTERFLKSKNSKVFALALYWISYLLIFILITSKSANPGEIKGYGRPVSISCGASFWHDGNGCGVDGNDCRPFDNAALAFRCPASCRDTLMQNPHPIGDKEALYTPLVVGGSNGTDRAIYRADSLICQSAIHADVISNTYGGCGVALLKGSARDFQASLANGIQSYAFDSSFPKSFTFLADTSGEGSGCKDVRWTLLVVSVIYTTILSVFVTSPAVFFWSNFLLLFLHTALISDPPDADGYSTLSSLFISRLFPGCFVAYAYYRYTIKRTLHGLTCQFEKTILWLGGAWIGALNNYTFKDIPIQRLTPHDLQQAGAIPALIVIVSILLAIAIGQAYYLWLEGRFRRYLALYIGFITLLLIGVAIPTMHVRIHHYLLAMLLLPGTSMQTRPSLLYQGILIGLFINGVARWGFAPIIETAEMLFNGRPEVNPLPIVTALLSKDLSRLDLSWSWPPEGYNGVSVLINDVERYRWYTDTANQTSSWSISSSGIRTENEYFRLSYLRDSSAVEYTQAGVWYRNHSWADIPKPRYG